MNNVLLIIGRPEDQIYDDPKEKLYIEDIDIVNYPIEDFNKNNLNQIIETALKESAGSILLYLNKYDENIIKTLSSLIYKKNKKNIPVLTVVTDNYEYKRIIDKISEMGIYDYLLSPTPEILIRKIKSSIEHKNNYHRAKTFESYYLSLFKKNSNLCFLLTPDLRVKLFNKSAMKTLELNPGSIGTNFPDIFRSNNIRKTLKNIFQDKKYINKEQFSFKTHFNTKSKNRLYINWNVKPFSGINGNILSFLLIGEENHKENYNSNNIKKSSNNDIYSILEEDVPVNTSTRINYNNIDNVEQKHNLYKYINKLKSELKKANTKLKETSSLKQELNRLKSELDINEKLEEELKEAKLKLKEMEKLREELEANKLQLNKIKELENHMSKSNPDDIDDFNNIRKEIEYAETQNKEIDRLRNNLEKAYNKIKEDKDNTKTDDFNKKELKELKNSIEKVKKHNDRLIKVLKQYTSKATWKYLLYRILSKKQASENNFVLEDFGTMVFGDIQGFTKFAEKYSPQDVLLSLNQMFNIVTKIVYENDGDIDKFMGDAFFAYFSKPINAIKAVVEIAKSVDELNDDRMVSGLTPLFFRFGINTGKAVRGDVGGDMRRENTLIGDTVNIAQRLESSSIPGQILISENTYNYVKEYILVGDKVELKLKGRKNMVIAYYLEGLKESNDEQKNEDKKGILNN
ncbi:MAG: adenylate/guanylate cyclase domain-containing protein [Spirochaetota bacterium]